MPYPILFSPKNKFMLSVDFMRQCFIKFKSARTFYQIDEGPVVASCPSYNDELVVIDGALYMFPSSQPNYVFRVDTIQWFHLDPTLHPDGIVDIINFAIEYYQSESKFQVALIPDDCIVQYIEKDEKDDIFVVSLPHQQIINELLFYSDLTTPALRFTETMLMNYCSYDDVRQMVMDEASRYGLTNQVPMDRLFPV
eukprot:GILJ01023068.1.p1 GENE.GILJ01023068.1~~GILJ01023068.1.p1  ORF type:complete len:196 (+),score=27.93 GILJ01023068.1:97-684(+)